MTNEKQDTPGQLSKEKKREIKTQYLAAFEDIRHNFSDELPPQKITAEDGNYKCRGNVICGIRNRIEFLKSQGLIKSDEAIKKSEIFAKQVEDRDFSVFSTREDVNRLNDILDVMIGELS